MWATRTFSTLVGRKSIAALFRVTTVKEKRDAPCKDTLSFASIILFSFVFLIMFHCGKLSRRDANKKNYMQEVCNHHLDGVVEDRVKVAGGRTERRFLALPGTVEPGNSGVLSIGNE